MSMICTNINIDSNLKQESQALFESLGLNLSTAVNMFLRQAVREQTIPFRVGAPIPNAETRTAIENAQHGIGLSRGFSSVSEFMEDLNTDDSNRRSTPPRQPPVFLFHALNLYNQSPCKLSFIISSTSEYVFPRLGSAFILFTFFLRYKFQSISCYWFRPIIQKYYCQI